MSSESKALYSRQGIQLETLGTIAIITAYPHPYNIFPWRFAEHSKGRSGPQGRVKMEHCKITIICKRKTTWTIWEVIHHLHCDCMHEKSSAVIGQDTSAWVCCDESAWSGPISFGHISHRSVRHLMMLTIAVPTLLVNIGQCIMMTKCNGWCWVTQCNGWSY